MRTDNTPSSPPHAPLYSPVSPAGQSFASRSRVDTVLHELTEKTRYLRIINDMAIDLLRVETLEEVLWLISRDAIASLGFDDCVIYLVDEVNHCLVQRAALGSSKSSGRSVKDPITVPMGRGIVGSVAASGKAEIVNDTRIDSRYIVDDASRLSEIAVPIIHNDKVIGVIDSENERPGFFTDSHLEVLTIIASITSAKVAGCLTVEALRNTVIQLEATSEKLKAREIELRQLARLDALTQLPNRRELMRVGEELVRNIQREGSSATLWYIDLDQFRLVNSRFGHGGGDALLIGLSQILVDNLHRNATVTRVGGDEFVVLLPDSTGASAKALCERVIEIISRMSIPYKEHRICATFSVGIADIDRHSTSLNAVLDAADKASYIAKRCGRNQCHVASANDASYRRHSDREMWAIEVGEALESGRLSIFTQPIFSMKEPRRIMMSETLLRLQRANGELVTASEFLAGCEQFDQMYRVDRFVVSSILDWIASHMADRPLPMISMNVSSASIDDPTFPEFLLDAVHRRNIDTRKVRLCVEITETTAISNIEQAQALVRVLNEHRIKVAVDDFGNGYASFALLKQLKVDIVKIDKLFTSTLSNSLDRKIVRSINEVAHEIGAITVAEGVEGQDALMLLRQIGIDCVQGYLFVRPMPIDALLEYDSFCVVANEAGEMPCKPNLMVASGGMRRDSKNSV